jgi:SAM-dependent methyltransferase
MKPSYYGPLRAQGYDIGTDVAGHMAFYVEHWKRLGCPVPLLEPMCGTGLNMVWYLQEGVECDGLDASSHMLDRCQKRLKELGFQSRLYEQNLEAMLLERQYGFIFIPGSLGHIYDNGVATRCLERMYSYLKGGGWLVLDVRQLSFMSKLPQDGEVDYDLDDYEDGSTVFTTGYWQHIENGRVIRKWNKIERYVDNVLQETEVFDYRERMYEEAELRGMLEQVGFKEIHVTKSYEHDVAPEGGDGFVFTCRKQ